MAVIGSIRKRSGLLIILIGMAILLFVLGDALGSGGLSGNVPDVGTINGESVDVTQLEQEAAKLEQLYASYGSSITREQARKQAWSNMVRDRVFFKNVKESGLSVTDDEYDDLRWGASLMDEFKNAPRYKGANGQFSPDSVQRFYASLYEFNPGVYKQEKKRIIESQLTNKYNKLIGKSIYYNSVDGKENAMGTSEKVSFQYASKRYSDIPDSTITVDEGMMKSYFNDHRNDKSLEQAESRSIEYVVFNATPTADDIESIRTETVDMMESFRNAKNDSTFVLGQSDLQGYTKVDYKKGTRTDEFDDRIANGAVGEVVGPYKDGDLFKIAKIIGKTEPFEEAKVRHILIKSAEESPVLKSRADSILSVIKRDSDQFDVLGAKFSEDNFDRNQGVYDYFPKGQMVTEFEDFSFNNPEGTMGVVKTQFGYHIIEVLGNRSEIRSTIVELGKNIEPSTETINGAYEMASNFAIDYGSEDKFNTGAAEKGYKIEKASKLGMSANALGTIQNAREVVRWAYDDARVKGEISPAFELDENFVVAKYISKTEKGSPTFEGVRDIVEAEVLKQMKGDKIIASISGAGDLDAVATSFGSEVVDANDVSFNVNGAAGTGNEPKLIGKAFTLPEGTMSEPIRGDQGIYVVKVVSKTAANTENANYSTNQNNLMRQTEASIVGKIQGAMNKAAGVENAIDKIF